MRRLFIIILDPNVDATTIRSRIAELGDHYIVYGNQYFVLAEFDNAQAVYERVVRNGDSPIGIVVLCVDADTLTYWGYSDKGLWEWLRSHSIQ